MLRWVGLHQFWVQSDLSFMDLSWCIVWSHCLMVPCLNPFFCVFARWIEVYLQQMTVRNSHRQSVHQHSCILLQSFRQLIYRDITFMLSLRRKCVHIGILIKCWRCLGLLAMNWQQHLTTIRFKYNPVYPHSDCSVETITLRKCNISICFSTKRGLHANKMKKRLVL